MLLGGGLLLVVLYFFEQSELLFFAIVERPVIPGPGVGRIAPAVGRSRFVWSKLEILFHFKSSFRH